MSLDLSLVPLLIPEGSNLIIGQAHFIKTVEDLAEIIVSSVPGVKYGIAFCEASGPRLIRSEGSDNLLISTAVDFARLVGAGHSFYILLGNIFPINILDRIKACPEVCHVFCATANPLGVIVARMNNGAGIIGVIDGDSPLRVENSEEKTQRQNMLKSFGYKFG